MKISSQLLMLSIIFILLFNACEKDDSSSSERKTKPDIELNKELLLDLVNNARTTGCDCGDTYFPPVNEVSWNNQLEEAALTHSKDMDDNNFFEHEGSDKSNAGERISKTGYIWTTWGENIAEGYSSEKAVIEAWIKSKSHCENIMQSDFTEMGVAKKGKYWTQVFAKPN